MQTELASTEVEVMEEFWDDLLAFIEERRVIPVVGPELLTVHDQGREVGLYRLLAERLLAWKGLQPADETSQDDSGAKILLRPHHELNDAVCALLAHPDPSTNKPIRIPNLYRPINDILNSILGPDPVIPESLRTLARIPHFDLFITTTIDDLLLRAINCEATGTLAPAAQVAYSPSMPKEDFQDIPEVRPTNCRAVFNLFGRSSSSAFHAIHDEDTLEYIHCLQTGNGSVPERMLAEVRKRHLLLIGCNFADWFSRFFIRVSNSFRLSSGDRKREFLIGAEATSDRSLTLFLESFSNNTRLYPGDARSFVDELARRWHERHPPPIAAETAPKPIEPKPVGSIEIFISYSRTDLAAAKVLNDELTVLGAGVIWFDKNAILPGDIWERQISAAIKRCDLFLPVISTTTEGRDEGYFRLEWKMAAERSAMIEGRPFLIPVVTDTDYSDDPGRYHLVPEKFPKSHFGHASGGHLSDSLKTSIINSIREILRRRSS
jgi:hypothetical protein